MSFRMVSLASGSEGNAVLAEYGSTRILIDAGLRYKSLCEYLSQLNVDPASISALLLTHEHSDHTLGLPVILKRLNLPVYTTYGTFEGLSSQAVFSRIPKAGFHLFHAGESFRIGELTLTGLPVQHDCLEPVAYRGDADGVHFAVITDLGCFDDSLIRSLQGLDALLLEANHNRQMLETGPYPYPLKLRIDGEKGHLSNEAAAGLLMKIRHPGLRQVLLGHLSRTNNYPLLALETVRGALGLSGSDNSIHISACPPKGPSDVIAIP